MGEHQTHEEIEKPSATTKRADVAAAIASPNWVPASRHTEDLDGDTIHWILTSSHRSYHRRNGMTVRLTTWTRLEIVARAPCLSWPFCRRQSRSLSRPVKGSSSSRDVTDERDIGAKIDQVQCYAESTRLVQTITASRTTVTLGKDACWCLSNATAYIEGECNKNRWMWLGRHREREGSTIPSWLPP